jgi:hypothetical protein
MARVFAYFMEKKIQNDETIFHDTSIIKSNSKKHALNNSKTNISATAFEIALKQLV